MKLAENLEKEREFKGKIKGALIYPAIVVSGMIMVMFVMITFVIPKLLTLYQDLDVELPLSTQILVVVSNFSQKFWPLIIIAAIGAGLGIRNYFRTKAGKIVKDNLMLKIPYFSKVIRIASLVDATRTLAILIGSGVSILEGLKIIIDTSDNVVFQNAFRNIYVKVEKGVSLGQAMADEKVFPPILVQMTTVGERTGHLDATLLRLSNYFEIESEFAVKAVTSLIEPAIIIVLGLGVGLLVFSVITPIYSLTNKF
jgi:type II secretory pathway component PulF